MTGARVPDQAAQVDLSVIICTYNRSDQLERLCTSLDRLDDPDGASWEVIIVDNNSTDGTAAVVDAWVRRSPRFRSVREVRQGKSYALNAGIAAARGAILAFTDDDVTVDPGWLRHLKRTFDRHDCAGVGGRVVPVWTAPKPSWLVTEGPFRLLDVNVSFDLGSEAKRLDTPPFGANAAFRLRVFRDHGLYRTDLGPVGARHLLGEDAEYGYRVLGAGEHLMYQPSAVVYHPAVPERMTRRYYLDWYMRYGRAAAQLGQVVPGAARYLGMPRYLLWQLAKALGGWWLGLGANRRFYHRLQAYRVLGMLREDRRMARQPAGDPVRPPLLERSGPS